MEQKIAAYICTGCGIGEALDIDKLSQVATKEGKVAICQTHPNLCGHGFIETHWSLLVEGSLHQRLVDDDHPSFHGEPGGKDVVDSVAKIVEILLAVDQEGEDSDFINLLRFLGLRPGGGRRQKQQGKNKA